MRGDDAADDEDEHRSLRRRNENVSNSRYSIAEDDQETAATSHRESLPLRRRTRNYHEHDSESDFEEKSQNKATHRRAKNGREAYPESESDVENDKMQDGEKTRRRPPMRQATQNLRYRNGESSEEESTVRKERFILADKKAVSKNVAPKTNGQLVDDEPMEEEAELDNSQIRRSSRILTKKALVQVTFQSYSQTVYIQWVSEIWTCLDFGYLVCVWFSACPDSRQCLKSVWKSTF